MTRGAFSENFLEVRVAILSIPDFWQKQLGAFVKTAFYERWGSFWKKRDFFRKFFSMFFGFGSNISWTFGKKNLVRWPKCRWKSSGEHFENNVFFWKKILLFQNLRQRRSEKGKIFRLPSLNCIIRDEKNILRKFFRRLEDLFCQFRTFSKNNSERLSKLLSMSPEDSFEKKAFFRKTWFFP